MYELKEQFTHPLVHQYTAVEQDEVAIVNASI